MTKNPETNEVTLHVDELRALVNQNDKQANVLVTIVNALKQYPDLFPRLADTEANVAFYSDFDLATDDILTDNFKDLKKFN